MTEPAENPMRWLAAARAGSAEALGQMLRDCHGYLLLIARNQLAPDLQAKGGASDLVQETCLDACRDFVHFRGEIQEELLAWLCQLLLHNLADFHRRYRDTAKRQTASELPLHRIDPSAPEAGALRDEKSPSEQAIAREQAESVQQALARLPEDYRRVLLLSYQEKLPFEEIGRLLGRSANAVEKLWARAIERLQHELEASS